MRTVCMVALVTLLAPALLCAEGEEGSRSVDNAAFRGWLDHLNQSSWSQIYRETERDRGRLDILSVSADDTVILGDSDSGELFRLEEGILAPQGRQKNVSDLAFEPGAGRVWALNAIDSTLLSWDPSGKQSAELKLVDVPRHFALISGDLVAVSAKGSQLIDIYDRTGVRVRGVGERPSYPSGDLDAYLNAGDVAGWADNVLFAFVYPGLLRSYSVEGKLNWEVSIPFNRPLAKPNIERTQSGDLMFIKAEYSQSFLDLAIDTRGYSYLLVSGEAHVVALSRGASRLDVVSPTGEMVGSAKLDFSCGQVAASRKYLYVLCRKPTRLLRVELPWSAQIPDR